MTPGALTRCIQEVGSLLSTEEAQAGTKVLALSWGARTVPAAGRSGQDDKLWPWVLRYFVKWPHTQQVLSQHIRGLEVPAGSREGTSVWCVLCRVAGRGQGEGVLA